MQDIMVGIFTGVAATAFLWILCAIIVRVRAKARKDKQEEIVEKISHILGAAFKGAKLLDEEESLQYIKSVEDLMNKNMPILGTDFLIILDKHLQLFKDYIKEVKSANKTVELQTAPPKPIEQPQEKPINPQTEKIQTIPKTAPRKTKQAVKPQKEIEIESMPEIKIEAPQTKIEVESNAEIKLEIPQTKIEDVKLEIPQTKTDIETKDIETKEENAQIKIETDMKRQTADIDKTIIKIEKKLIDGLFPESDINIRRPNNKKSSEEHISEKTTFFANSPQNFQMKDVIKENEKNNLQI